MKLINEGNWKQELALLKAERIMLKRVLDKVFGAAAHGWLSKNEKELLSKEEKLDKAIETIENVFVRKQCYIDD